MAALTAVTTFSIIPDVVLMTVSLSCYVSVSHKSVTDTDFAQKPVFPFFCDHAGRSLRSAANANFTTYSKVHRSNLGNQCTSPDRPTSGIALKAKRSPPSLPHGRRFQILSSDPRSNVRRVRLPRRRGGGPLKLSQRNWVMLLAFHDRRQAQNP